MYASIESACDSAHSSSPIVPVLMGPTGSGKTAIAVEIARQYPITAIVADLRQVMRGMEIGSAQPTADELAILPHKLSGILDPSRDITVNDWRRLALTAISETFAENRIPIILGGSGMCIKALISGEKYDALPAPILRPALNDWVSRAGLKTVVDIVEPIIAGVIRIDEYTNRQRVVRGIERFAFKTSENDPPIQLPTPVRDAWQAQCEKWNVTDNTAELSTEITQFENQYKYRVFTLLPNRVWLRKRIEERARLMFETGLLKEVQELLESGVAQDARALKGHGYPEAIAVLSGKMTIDEAVERTTINTVRYAKRQITWIKHQLNDVNWIEVGNQ